MIVGTNANICGSECVYACTGVRSCVFVRIVEVQGSAVSNLDTLTFTDGHAFTRTQAHEYTYAHARTHTHTHAHTHTQQANTRAIMILRSIVWKPSSLPTFDLQVKVCALACGRMRVFHVCKLQWFGPGVYLQLSVCLPFRTYTYALIFVLTRLHPRACAHTRDTPIHT